MEEIEIFKVILHSFKNEITTKCDVRAFIRAATSCKYLLDEFQEMFETIFLEFKNYVKLLICDFRCICGLKCYICSKNNTFICDFCVCSRCKISGNISGNFPYYRKREPLCYQCVIATGKELECREWMMLENIESSYHLIEQISLSGDIRYRVISIPRITSYRESPEFKEICRQQKLKKERSIQRKKEQKFRNLQAKRSTDFKIMKCHHTKPRQIHQPR